MKNLKFYFNVGTLHVMSFLVCFIISNLSYGQKEQNSAIHNDNATLNKLVMDIMSEVKPFSFTYDGKKSSDFLIHWAFEYKHKKIDDLRDGAIYTLTDPKTGLQVKCVATIYSDFPVVEWTLYFKNTSDKNTPILDNIKTIDTKFEFKGKKSIILHTPKGSSAERIDFMPIDLTMVADTNVQFGPDQGRSSDTDASPFFNLDAGDEGIMGAVGWTGRWLITAKLNKDNSVNYTAGFRKVHTYLMPGEEIRTPMILVMPWKGKDRMVGHNLFRRFILKYHTPQKDGKPVVLPFAANPSGGGPVPPCNENSCTTEEFAIAMLNRFKQFDIQIEDFWIDAGWYEGSQESWWRGVGNWIPNKQNFPNGLRPIADAAKKIGMGFVLWFEPERVYEGTKIDKEHPEWIIKLKDNPSRLFNLGIPEARKYLTDLISGIIEKEGVTVYRQDFNFDPLPYWESMDKPDRIGMTEIKHIEGLYAFWDELLARHPGLLIDNCASGGRRIDLETIGRSVPLWRTDYGYFEPNGYQSQTYGLSFYLPCNGTGNINPTPYDSRSAFSSALVTGWSFGQDGSKLGNAKNVVAEYKRVRPYFYGDYYPLTGYDASDNAFMSYQFNRPESDDGIIFAFRRNACSTVSITVKPGGLKPDKDYEVNFEDYGIVITKSGKELMDKGFEIKIPDSPGSLLISYKVKTN